MTREFYEQHWSCIHCGGSGSVTLEVGMYALAVHHALVRSHSLRCPGCDGDAAKTLRLLPVGSSEADKQRARKRAKDLAAHADHSEGWMSKLRWLPWPF